jgi:hypothetical protein
LKFCPTCDSALNRKNRCKCETNNNLTTNESINSNESTSSELFLFPFEKEKYYEQGIIRNKCHAHKQWGISYNQIDNYWVLLKNKKSNTNTYYDRMDENGVFHYTGQGLKGDQIMAGNNDGLKNATSNGQKIHLFWKYNQNSDHKYVGEVKVERIDEEIQNDQDDLPRKVFVFSLRPID